MPLQLLLILRDYTHNFRLRKATWLKCQAAPLRAAGRLEVYFPEQPPTVKLGGLFARRTNSKRGFNAQAWAADNSRACP